MPELTITQQITFLHTQNLAKTHHFYTGILGLKMVRDQSTCRIYKTADNAYLGFCEHIEPINPGRRIILTLVTDDVDGWYETLKARGARITSEPKANAHYQIYHFFLIDPDGYWIEIQRFDHPL